MSEAMAEAARDEAWPILPPASVALIGLGRMGVPMALRLAAAGYRVHGHDASPGARERFPSTSGVTVFADAAEAVEGTRALATMLPDGKIVRAVLESVLPRLSPGAIVIDMSSSAPLGTRALGEILAASGVAFIDAPVSGGVKRAADGTLAVMAGGDPAVIDRAEPMLKAMGSAIFRTGPLGSGHAMKALNNYVSGAGLVAALEALRVGRAFGLDPAVMVDALNASTGRNNSTENKLKQFVLSGSFASGFALGLMAKDIRAAEELAAALGVAAPLAARTADLWDEAARRLGAQADHTEIDRLLAAPWRG
jgi:3-hydroxyisobutyrate dehydrogenase